MIFKMFYFERFLLEYFNVLNSFGRKYVVGENRFIRNRKMTLEDIVYYILTNKGRSNYIEAIDFINKKSKHGFNSITPQAIGKQRQYLMAEIFIKISEAFIDRLYKQFKGFSSFKGYLVLACDGSIFDLPNTQSLNQINKLKSNNRIIEINLTNGRLKSIRDEILREKLRNINERFKIRIVK